MKKTLTAALLLLYISICSSGQTADLLQSDRYLSANIQHPYIVPEIHDTHAPAGFKPFYITHYGRHGSRYHLDNKIYDNVLPTLDRLHDKGLLTETGEAIREDISRLREAQKGCVGILTQTGSLEHQGIGRRMYDRFPQVFNQKDRKVVYCISSHIQRCIQSMANFTLALKGKAPGLDFQLYTGEKYFKLLVNGYDMTVANAATKAVMDSLTLALIEPTVTGARFFTDCAAAGEVIGDRSLAGFLFNMYEVSGIARCFDGDAPDPLAHFTTDELAVMSRIYNVRNCGIYSHSVETGELAAVSTGRPILEDVISKAEAAIAGNDRCADLRFGHDSGIGPFLAYIRVEGYDAVPHLAESYKVWPAWKYLPMGTNFQMIFYRNRKGEILVKMLRNEEETTIPAVPTFYGPYYRWTDLKAYFDAKIRNN